MRRAFTFGTMMRPAVAAATATAFSVASSISTLRSCATNAAAAAESSSGSGSAQKKKKDSAVNDPEALIDSILAASDEAVANGSGDDESLFWLTDNAASSAAGNNNNKASPDFLRVLAAAAELTKSSVYNSFGGKLGNRTPDAIVNSNSTNNNKAAAKVFASIAPYMTSAPVVILARLLATNWPATVCTPEMRKRMRREVFSRISDLQSGEEVGRVLIAWSLNKEHAADLGMFKKLGKLLEYHMHGIQSTTLLLQAVRALRRARIQPPPEFIDLVARRIVVLQRNAELRARMMLEAAAAASAKAGPHPSKDLVAALKEMRKKQQQQAGDDAFYLLSARDGIRALRLFAGFGASTIPRFLVVALVRVVGESLERQLVVRGAIDPAQFGADDLLGSYPHLLKKKEADTASQAEQQQQPSTSAAADDATQQPSSSSSVPSSTNSTANKSPQQQPSFSHKSAIAILDAARLTPSHLSFILSTLSTYRVTTTKYTRPFAVLMGALAPKMTNSVLFSLFLPSLVRFPAGTACSEILVKQIVKRADHCGWEDLVNSARLVVSYLEHVSSNDLASLNNDNNSCNTSSSSNSNFSTDAKTFFEIVHKKFSHFVRAPTTWQMVLLARYMQRASKAEGAGSSLAELVNKQALPTIVARFTTLLDMGVAPLKHFDHLDETLVLAGITSESEPTVAKLRALRREIETSDVPYRRRFSASAVFLPLYHLNDSVEFNRDGLLDEQQRRVLRGFSVHRLVPCHPALLLKALHAFETAFPKVLQPAIRREFTIVLENKLRVPVAVASSLPSSSASSSASSPAAAAAVATTSEAEVPGAAAVPVATTASGKSRRSGRGGGAIVPKGANTMWSNSKPTQFESKAAVREFTDLFWKAAPKACKTSVHIWEFIAYHARQHGDEVLLRKANQIVATLKKLRL